MVDIEDGRVAEAMREGVPEEPENRCCGNCAHWHTEDGGAGICDRDLSRLSLDPDVLKLAITDEGRSCSEWSEWEGWR